MTETTNTQGNVAYDASDAVLLAGKAQRLLATAQAFVIDSPTMYELAAGDLQKVKALAKDVEEKRTAITGPLNQAVKAVNDLFRSPKDFLATAETALKSAMITYDREQQRKADEARREAERIAREERQRIEAEAREAARRAQEEADRIAKEAADAAAAGDAAKAAELQQQAEQTAADGAAQAETIAMEAEMVTAAPVPVATAAPKVAGLSTRQNWKARLTDKMALIKFVAAHPEHQHLLDVNQSAINQLAKAQKDAMNLPGVEAYPDAVMSARAA
jgi:DNA polymerase III gamma/tau subunit